MTKKTKEAKGDNKDVDMKRYQYAELARRYGQSEVTMGYIPSALEKLASDMKEVSETESELIRTLVQKGEGLESLLKIYPGKYEKEKSGLTVAKFLDSYDKVISGYLDEEKAKKLKDTFGKLGASTLGDVNKKLDEAAFRLTGHKKGYENLSDEDVKKYEGIVEKYKAITDTIKQIEDIYFTELGAPVVKEANKRALAGLVDKLK